MARVEFGASAVLSAGVPKMGTTVYGVAEQKGVWRTVLYNGFRFVLGYRDWPTLVPWTSNGVGSLEPKKYCIFLPGAHYLTINSPNGADSSLNKLLLLPLLLTQTSRISTPHMLLIPLDSRKNPESRPIIPMHPNFLSEIPCRHVCSNLWMQV